MEPTLLLEKLNTLDKNLLNDRVPKQSAFVCGLSLKTEQAVDQCALESALKHYIAEFPQACGWLCRQSDVVWFCDGERPRQANIQYGEIAGDSNHSLLIRPDGNGGFRLIYQQELEGKTHLAIPHQHIGRRRPLKSDPVGELIYRTYWTRPESDTESSYRAVTTRLLNITQAKEKA
jgi:hypothetical protein